MHEIVRADQALRHVLQKQQKYKKMRHGWTRTINLLLRQAGAQSICASCRSIVFHSRTTACT